MDNKYDVVVIGAGIGGLVAGCYLAKAGLKVLIVEKHFKPGGYCTSFDRQGYKFDVGVHYLGSIKRGILGKILEELNLKEEIKINRFDPTDKIIMPDNITYIRANLSDTVEEFIKSFPKEKDSIEEFFSFVTQENFFDVYRRCRNVSLKIILDHFFNDFRIKSTLEVLMGNIGISGSKISALSAIILYRDYLLDGGYYPEGGMQAFADVLATAFKNYGGTLSLCKEVKKILVKDAKTYGVLLEDNVAIESNFVISNADATYTFKMLLENYECRENSKVNKLDISPSIFGLYVGVEKQPSYFTKDTCNIWYFSTYRVGECLSKLKRVILKPNLPYIFASFPSAHLKAETKMNTVQFLLVAPFESENFWNRYKGTLAEKIINKSGEILPNLSENIKLKVIATPRTFYRYTYNRNGSAFGWSSTVNQVFPKVFPQKTSIRGLYLAGHWCTIGSGQGGVPKVAFAGKNAADLILRKQETEKKGMS